MEKAVLKTLLYADIFDYPLKLYEIHKWLIGPPAGRAGKKVILRQTEKALEKLRLKGGVIRIKDYYFLPNRRRLVSKRAARTQQSANFLRKAKLVAYILQLIPWIKLIGISGGLAMNNADKNDDIDLFIVTAKNRLWLSRLILIGILDILRIRRQPKMSSEKASGKLCLNILLEEDKLSQENKDIFIAHEVLQMKVLWQRGNTYKNYLEDNQWIFKFLPNWIAPVHLRGEAKLSSGSHLGGVAMISENLAKWLQLKLMIKPQGKERITERALYFHPEDYRLEILTEYKKRTRKISRAVSPK